MYRRMRPALDYEAFLRFPNPDTLLDRPTHWRLFVESWLGVAGDSWLPFEAYKKDAAATLRGVLARLGLSYSAEQIERAVLESSFDQARAAEERYKTQFPGDWEVANRAGRVGDWIEQTEARTGSALIESRTEDVMRRLGYECPASTLGPPVYNLAIARCLPLFSRICLPASVAAQLADDRRHDPPIDEALAFSAELDEALLRRTNLPSHRIRRLLDSLASVARDRGWDTAENISRLRERFGEGSEHQFGHLRDLLIRRRARRQDS